MARNIEREGNAPFGERRVIDRKRSPWRSLNQQRLEVWPHRPQSPLAPPHSFSLQCW
jgi:hypothetical protein